MCSLVMSISLRDFLMMLLRGYNNETDMFKKTHLSTYPKQSSEIDRLSATFLDDCHLNSCLHQ